MKEELKGVFSIHDLGQIKKLLGCEVSIDPGMGSLKMTNVLRIENLAVEYGITHRVTDDLCRVYRFCIIRVRTVC